MTLWSQVMRELSPDGNFRAWASSLFIRSPFPFLPFPSKISVLFITHFKSFIPWPWLCTHHSLLLLPLHRNPCTIPINSLSGGTWLGCIRRFWRYLHTLCISHLYHAACGGQAGQALHSKQIMYLGRVITWLKISRVHPSPCVK